METNETVDEVQTVEPTTEGGADIDEQYKNDMFKFKRQYQESLKEKEQLAAKIKEIEENSLKEKEDYKSLYENTAQRLREVEEDKKGIFETIVQDKKISAIREHAAKLGLRNEAFDDLGILDMSDVVVETTSQGNFNVLGADNFVDRLKSSKPHWFKDLTPPNVNNSTGSFDGNTKTYSPQEVIKLQKEDPALYKKIMSNQKLIKRS